MERTWSISSRIFTFPLTLAMPSRYWPATSSPKSGVSSISGGSQVEHLGNAIHDDPHQHEPGLALHLSHDDAGALRVLGRCRSEFQAQIDHRDYLPRRLMTPLIWVGVCGTAVISCSPMISRTFRTRMPNSSLAS